jgi:hypothetical protein
MTSMVNYMLDGDRLREGVKLPLFDRQGNPSDDWIKVRSMHCEEFQMVMESAQQELRKGDGDQKELTLKAQVQLVADWSFDEECNAENVRNFLVLAPHIASRIDKAAGNNALFFPDRGASSLNGQGSKLPSKRKSRKQTRPSASL